MATKASNKERVIKKYPNRRLYDTDGSSYITLADVKQLVVAGEPFRVQDAKTGEDLTRSILLQIILEAEAGGAPIFSEAVLAQIIRVYGHAMQGMMGAMLEKNIQVFAEMQDKFAQQTQQLGQLADPRNYSPEAWAKLLQGQTPAMQGLMSSYMEQSQALVKQMQEQMRDQAKTMLGAFGLKR
jgi:polyhydroxyalkanoate synthesis repressor PhaR